MYGAIAGIFIFLGEKLKKEMEGARFMNKRTGKIEAPTFFMHLKYFFLNEQRHFCVVVLICIVMTVALFVFLGYHLDLARHNMTTNESFKHAAE